MLMASKSFKKPEVWGGIECSFNRVKDIYMDQLVYAGHYERALEDIARIAELGIKVMRYPVIWERLRPERDHVIDWSGTSEKPLNAIRDHGITPIVGLVHHGSGPRYADILSPAFATGLSDFAGEVARQFPWVEYYTPVNEPLTTARFSCLYGVWYPHRKNDRAFVQAILNEMKGVVLAMQEIRKVNPDAKLVQTEDLAKIYSTPHMQYQAKFENHRRWLPYDILCGRLNRNHPLYEYFIRSGATEQQLRFFINNPCPPDIIGVDYYATSERYLDENIERYPSHTHGRNHRDVYADVEAFRVRHGQPAGIGLLLKECWERYHISIAVTEIHINCDYDNQIRWFSEIRNACAKMISSGADIKAVTAWALLGSYGWNKLITSPNGDYESGVFDVSTGDPIATPMADYLKEISKNPDYIHPSEKQKGWWRRDDRFIYERYDEALVDDTPGDQCKLRGEH